VTVSHPPPGRSFRLVLATTFASFCALYSAQPLLPTFALEFGVAPARSAWLLTVCFVALAIAPLLYGAVLQRFSAQRLLVFSTAALGLLQLVFALAPDFSVLLGSRVLQGLLFPAIFAAGHALIFLVFFTFSGLLTVLPFRLVALDPDIAAGTISLVYPGYLVGVLIAFDIARISRIAGSAERAMAIALVLFAAGLALSASPSATAPARWARCCRWRCSSGWAGGRCWWC